MSKHTNNHSADCSVFVSSFCFTRWFTGLLVGPKSVTTCTLTRGSLLLHHTEMGTSAVVDRTLLGHLWCGKKKAGKQSERVALNHLSTLTTSLKRLRRCSPISQFLPPKFGLHQQTYVFTPSSHTPSFRQGGGLHWSPSTHKYKNTQGDVKS